MKAIRIIALLLVIAAAVGAVVFQMQQEKTRRQALREKKPLPARAAKASDILPAPPPPPEVGVYEPTTLQRPIEVVLVYPPSPGDKLFAETRKVLDRLAKEYPNALQVEAYTDSDQGAFAKLQAAGQTKPGCVIINGHVAHRLKQEGTTQEVTFTWDGMNQRLNYKEADLEALLRQYLERADKGPGGS